MFIPNLDCTIEKATTTDLYGKVGMGAAIAERCAVVKLKTDAQHTTVRADSSGTRGFAEEFVSESKVLLNSTTAAALNDCLTVFKVKIRIVGMHPRFSVLGTLDHYEIRGELWDS